MREKLIKEFNQDEDKIYVLNIEDHYLPDSEELENILKQKLRGYFFILGKIKRKDLW